jgi:hypothetical protein
MLHSLGGNYVLHSVLHSHNNAKGENHRTAIALGPLQARASQEQNPKPIFWLEGPTTVPGVNATMPAQLLARGLADFFYIFFTK